jgi:uncharacterized protein (TIGR02145 family)
MMKVTSTVVLLFACIAFWACSRKETVTDVDGNVYATVRIGRQVWMAENLRVLHYRNGDPIAVVPDARTWAQTRDGALCFYRNDSSFSKSYGALYNWYAVHDRRAIAPEGWHLPEPEEIDELVTYLQGDTIAGGKLKEAGSGNWTWPNAGATDEWKFRALPAGYRLGDDGSFHTAGSNAYWWSGNRSFEIFAWSPRIFGSFADAERDKQYLTYGLSVRCIKDR